MPPTEPVLPARSGRAERSPAARALRRLSGVILLLALGIAPLNYGSTRPAPFLALIILAAAGGLAWALAGLLGGGFVAPPPAVEVGCILLAVVVAAWTFFLPRPMPPDFTLQHYARVAARWPFSVVPRTPGLLMGWAAAALLAFAALHDLARDPVWRRAIATMILLTGAAVALLGLAENITHAPGIYWDASHRLPGAFFGPFFHHTAAGAYLNTVWPLGFALTLQYVREGARLPVGGIFGPFFCATLVLAAHAGHVSRAPQVIALAVLAGFILWIAPWRTLASLRLTRSRVLLALALLLGGGCVLAANRLHEISARWALLNWDELRGGRAAVAPPPPAAWPGLMRDDLFVPSDHGNYPLGDRGAAYATAAAAILDRPWFGWGPGGWLAAAAANTADPFVRTFYLFLQFTHEDYLQTCVEWGLIGALGWALVIPGAAAHALLRLGRHPGRDLLGAGAAAGLVAVLLQSLLDFPLQIPAIQFNVVALAALAWSVRGERRIAPPLSLP